MNAVLIIGFAILVLSAFFILFSFDFMIKGSVGCFQSETKISCDTATYGLSLIVGLFVVVSFLILDSGVVYLLAKHAFNKHAGVF